MKNPVCKDELKMEMDKVHQSMTETAGNALTVSEKKKGSSNLLGKEIEHLLVLQNVTKGEQGDKKKKIKLWMKLKNIKPPFLSLDRWWWAETVENIQEDNWDGWHSNRVATWNVKAQAESRTFKSLPKEEREEILKRLELLHNAANDNEKQDNIAIVIMKMILIS